jgi:hypothetical protein
MRGKRWLWLGGALAIFVFHALLFRDFVVDDAYISFRFVQQWVGGNGLVFNVGERVEGYSNFLWVVLLAALHRVGLPLLTAARALGVASSVGTLVLVHRLSARRASFDVASVLLASTPAFAAWSVGGLETPLYAFLALAASASFAAEEERGRGSLSGALFALLALTRPEGLLFALVALLFRAARLRREGARPERRDLLRLAGFALVFGPFFLWRLGYYGHPLPNTVYAKHTALHAKILLGGLLYHLRSCDAAGGFFFLALPVAAALVERDRAPRTLHFAACVAAYLGVATLEGKDWMPLQRVFVHVLPLVMVLVNDGVAALARLDLPHAARLAPAIAAAHALFLLGRSVDEKATGPQEDPWSFAAELDYLARHVRDGDVIAVEYAGKPAYQAPLGTRVLDMVGLTDGHIAHLRPQGDLWAHGVGFGKWDVDYVLAARPRFVQVVDRGAEGRPKLQFRGSELLLADPRFARDYAPVEERGLAGIYVRRDDRPDGRRAGELAPAGP